MFTFKGDDPNSSTNYTIFQMNFEVGFANKNDDSYNLNFNINEVLKDISKNRSSPTSDIPENL